MDAITLLKDDHKTVEALFKRFEKAGDNAHVEKRQIADRISEELSKHAAIEETLFYPVTRATVPETEDIALESLEEHHIVKWVLSEIDAMDPADERFDAKVTVLMENVRHHIKEEEEEYFPMVRAELGRKALAELGEAMADAKKTAPTHPHPRSPDTPPGNVVTGNTAGVMDKIGDTVSGIAQGSVAAAQDLVARITGSKSAARSPKGTSVARSTATKVRKTAQEVADDVRAVAVKAEKTGEQTVTEAATRTKEAAEAARSGVKGTATSVKKGAARTGAAAKRGASNTGSAAKRAARTTKATAKRGATTTARKATAAS